MIMSLQLLITPFGAVPIMGQVHPFVHSAQGPYPKFLLLQQHIVYLII